ncbi:MAG: trigger factor [Bacillota bacterium]
MQVTSERLEKSTVLLQVEVETERFNQAVERAYRKVAKDVAIPGFRKGKVPKAILERYMGKDKLYEEAATLVLGEVYPAAVSDAGIEPVSQPEVEIIQAEEGKPLIFKAKVEVKPEVELGQYKGIEVVRRVKTVTREDVDAELERLRNRYARLVTVEDGTVDKGDIVTMDYEGTIEGKAFSGGTARGREVEVGHGYLIPGIDEALVGMRAGETKEVEVDIPSETPDAALAGKKALFQLTVKSIRRKELMPYDDDLAKEVSEFDTLEELKADLENKLREAAEDQTNLAVRQEILDKVVEHAKVEIPPSMITEHVEGMVEDMVNTAEGRGVEPQRFFQLLNSSPEEMRERMKPDAEKTIKMRLVLDAIAKAENLEAPDEEVDEEIAKLAAVYRQDPQELRKALEDGGRLDVVKGKLLREKAIGLLVDNAVMKEETPLVEGPGQETSAEEQPG